MGNKLYQNEKMKRKYFDFCRNAKGFSLKTMKKIEGAVYKYDEYSKNIDYKQFNSEKAKGFKKWLASNKNNKGQSLGLSTQFHILRLLKGFFIWLSQQSGYKSKISFDDIEYLSLSRAESRMATSSKQPAYPSKEYVLRITSFKINNDIDLRDRALISFTAMSGMRDLAIVTLPFGAYEKENQTINQDPNLGVKTKFSKTISTKLIIFDDKLLEYFHSWVEKLESKYIFSIKDPLFPATEIGLKSDTEHSFVPIGISKFSWNDAGAMREIFRKRATQMGLDYFSPHKFRHFNTSEALRYATNAEQIKAISQNLGHEKVSTTLFSYGAIDSFRLPKVIGEINEVVRKESKL